MGKLKHPPSIQLRSWEIQALVKNRFWLILRSFTGNRQKKLTPHANARIKMDGHIAHWESDDRYRSPKQSPCPHGRPGQILDVIESFFQTPDGKFLYRATDPPYPSDTFTWRPPSMLPRPDGVRFQILVLSVVARRLHTITPIELAATGWNRSLQELWTELTKPYNNAQTYGQPWEANPWVWTVTVRKVEREDGE